MGGLPDWAQVKPKRRAHIERVATLIGSWADAAGTSPTERERWLRAAYLHDALRDAMPDLLQDLAGVKNHAPALLHGPAAAEYAAQHGERDRGVLDAVRYHSVGYAGWDDAGRMLYLADYLEPGREFREDQRRAMAARVPSDARRVMKEVASERIQWLISSGWLLLPETVDFWNALAQES